MDQVQVRVTEEELQDEDLRRGLAVKTYCYLLQCMSQYPTKLLQGVESLHRPQEQNQMFFSH